VDTRTAISARSVSKRYGTVRALSGVSFQVAAGETVALVGPSGAGKTTLLYVLSGILPADDGSVVLFGRPLESMDRKELARTVGVMHQQFDLVPALSVLHNVLAGRLSQWSLARSLVSLIWPRERRLALAALARVGIADKLYERTSRLSGGQQQRVAIARLLLQNPQLILADEPVSALDPARAEDVMRLLVGIAREDGRTLVASLHAVDLALKHFQRIVAIRDGVLVFDRPAGRVGEGDLRLLYSLEEQAGTEQGETT
jgi:phosphonate transport system ATP-binding protein